jgi:hypothetical protein
LLNTLLMLVHINASFELVLMNVLLNVLVMMELVLLNVLVLRIQVPMLNAHIDASLELMLTRLDGHKTPN